MVTYRTADVTELLDQIDEHAKEMGAVPAYIKNLADRLREPAFTRHHTRMDGSKGRLDCGAEQRHMGSMEEE